MVQEDADFGHLFDSSFGGSVAAFLYWHDGGDKIGVT